MVRREVQLTETIHIDAGVDKSLIGAFHAGEIQKSIKHGYVTSATTRRAPTEGVVLGMENDGGIAMVIGFLDTVDRVRERKVV